MANDIIASVKFRTDLTELEQAEDQLKAIEDNLRAINDPKSMKNLDKAFEQLNQTVEEGSLSFSEMGKAIEQYQTIALKAGLESPVGKEAISRAGQLKDEMDQVTASVDILSKKGVALQGALELGTGITAGYGAFVGITQLAGAESEKFEKALTKLMAVQTTLSSIEQIRNVLRKESILAMKAQEMWTGLMAISEKALTKARIIQTTATTGAMVATKALSVALAASGIGLIVLALGTLASSLSDTEDETNDLIDAQELLAEQLRLTNKEINKQSEALGLSFKLLDNATKSALLSARQRGASDVELTKIMIEGSKARQTRLNEEIEVAKSFLDAQTAGTESWSVAYKALTELQQQGIELNNQIQNSELDLQEQRIALAEAEKKRKEQEAIDAQENGHVIMKVEAKRAESLEQVKIDARESYLITLGRLLKKEGEMIKESADNQKEIDRQLQNSKREMAKQGLDSLAQLITAFGAQDEAGAKRQFAITKALNIGKAVINTAQGITQAIAQFGPPPSPLGIAGIASATAIGVAQIATIARQKFQTNTTGGGGSFGSSSTGGAVSGMIGSVSNLTNQSNESTNIEDIIGGSGSGSSSGMVPVLVTDSFTKVLKKQEKIQALGSL